MIFFLISINGRIPKRDLVKEALERDELLRKERERKEKNVMSNAARLGTYNECVWITGTFYTRQDRRLSYYLASGSPY